MGLGRHTQRFCEQCGHLPGRPARARFDAADGVLGAAGHLCQLKLGQVERFSARSQPLPE
jgi:hypothetical protein